MISLHFNEIVFLCESKIGSMNKTIELLKNNRILPNIHFVYCNANKGDGLFVCGVIISI